MCVFGVHILKTYSFYAITLFVAIVFLNSKRIVVPSAVPLNNTQFPVSIIHNTKKHIMVREIDLIPFVLFSYDYHDFLRRHLKQRKSLEAFKKVTKYLGEDAFIIHKREVIVYGELPIPKLFIFLMDNTFSKYNKEILKAFLRL